MPYLPGKQKLNATMNFQKEYCFSNTTMKQVYKATFKMLLCEEVFNMMLAIGEPNLLTCWYVYTMEIKLIYRLHMLLTCIDNVNMAYVYSYVYLHCKSVTSWSNSFSLSWAASSCKQNNKNESLSPIRNLSNRNHPPPLIKVEYNIAHFKLMIVGSGETLLLQHYQSQLKMVLLIH